MRWLFVLTSLRAGRDRIGRLIKPKIVVSPSLENREFLIEIRQLHDARPVLFR